MNQKPVINDALQQELDDALATLAHFKTGLAFTSLASTNDHAHAIVKNVDAASVIMAAKQFQGRGRLMRTWHMQEGDIAMSIIIRPPLIPKNLALLPLIPGLAVVDALKNLSIDVRLKWPNDIIIPSTNAPLVPYFLNFRKVGGILVENVFDHERLIAAIIGIGLNLTAKDYLERDVPHVSSIFAIDQTITRKRCLSELLQAFDKLLLNHDDNILKRYRNYCETIGRDVSIEYSGKRVRGRVVKMNDDGSLVVNDGTTDHIVFAGDVHFQLQ